MYYELTKFDQNHWIHFWENWRFYFLLCELSLNLGVGVGKLKKYLQENPERDRSIGLGSTVSNCQTDRQTGRHTTHTHTHTHTHIHTVSPSLFFIIKESYLVEIHQKNSKSIFYNCNYFLYIIDIIVYLTMAIIIIRVFCPRAGPSLQAQVPRLQFCRRQVFHRKLRNQGCSFIRDWIGAVISRCFPHHTLSLASEQTLKDLKRAQGHQRGGEERKSKSPFAPNYGYILQLKSETIVVCRRMNVISDYYYDQKIPVDECVLNFLTFVPMGINFPNFEARKVCDNGVWFVA